MTTTFEPDRTAYEARFAGEKFGPRGTADHWDDLPDSVREVWRRVEVKVLASAEEGGVGTERSDGGQRIIDGLSEAIAETMRRAEKDQEFLRRTLEKRRREAEAEHVEGTDAILSTLTPAPPFGLDRDAVSRGDETNPADLALQRISLALGGSDEWSSQENMIADVERLVEERLCALASPNAAGGGERVRHRKRRTEYEVLGEAEAQVSRDSWGPSSTRRIADGSVFTVYRCVETGKLWCRPTDEFRDGRFEPAPPTTSSGTRGS